MLISVIVPIYNVEKYLRQCLDSILAQTYKELEVIMVDDGSPDNCGAICDEYAAKYGNFIAVHKENAGLGMARNTGLEYVTGEYVMFLDSDDYIDPDLIETLYKTVVKRNVDMCKSGCRRVKDNGYIFATKSYKDEFFVGKDVLEKLMPRFIGSLPDKKDSYEVSVWASLYKTDIVKKYNILFPSERNPETTSEDIFFNIDYMRHAKRACVVSSIGYNYRANMGTLSKKYNSNAAEVYFLFYKNLEKKLLEIGCTSSTFCRLKTMMLLKLKKCIYMESKKYSGNSMAAATKNIDKICMDPRTQDIVNSYPIKQLMFKRKVFVYMLKYKMSFILYICANLGVN